MPVQHAVRARKRHRSQTRYDGAPEPVSRVARALPRTIDFVRPVVVDKYGFNVVLFSGHGHFAGETGTLLGGGVLSVVAFDIRDASNAITGHRVGDDLLHSLVSLADVEHLAAECSEPHQSQGDYGRR